MRDAARLVTWSGEKLAPSCLLFCFCSDPYWDSNTTEKWICGFGWRGARTNSGLGEKLIQSDCAAVPRWEGTERADVPQRPCGHPNQHHLSRVRPQLRFELWGEVLEFLRHKRHEALLALSVPCAPRGRHRFGLSVVLADGAISGHIEWQSRASGMLAAPGGPCDSL